MSTALHAVDALEHGVDVAEIDGLDERAALERERLDQGRSGGREDVRGHVRRSSTMIVAATSTGTGS